MFFCLEGRRRVRVSFLLNIIPMTSVTPLVCSSKDLHGVFVGKRFLRRVQTSLAAFSHRLSAAVLAAAGQGTPGDVLLESPKFLSFSAARPPSVRKQLRAVLLVKIQDLLGERLCKSLLFSQASSRSCQERVNVVRRLRSSAVIVAPTHHQVFRGCAA